MEKEERKRKWPAEHGEGEENRKRLADEGNYCGTPSANGCVWGVKMEGVLGSVSVDLVGLCGYFLCLLPPMCVLQLALLTVISVVWPLKHNRALKLSVWALMLERVRHLDCQ